MRSVLLLILGLFFVCEAHSQIELRDTFDIVALVEGKRKAKGYRLKRVNTVYIDETEVFGEKKGVPYRKVLRDTIYMKCQYYHYHAKFDQWGAAVEPSKILMEFECCN